MGGACKDVQISNFLYNRYVTENKKRDMWFRESGTHKASKCMTHWKAAPQFTVQLNSTDSTDIIREAWPYQQGKHSSSKPPKLIMT